MENIKNNQIESRKAVIIARGEHSDHCHAVIGEAEITRDADGNIIITAKNDDVVLAHILESAWLTNGSQVWTKEHKDTIALPKGHRMKYVPQIEYDPYAQKIRQVQD